MKMATIGGGVKFKVYFEDLSSGCEGIEVRKLNMDSLPTFHNLTAHLKTVLNNNESKIDNVNNKAAAEYDDDQAAWIKIQYVDEDNDRVSITCQQELEAFYQVSIEYFYICYLIKYYFCAERR